MICGGRGHQLVLAWALKVRSVVCDQFVGTCGNDITEGDGVKLVSGPDQFIVFALLVFFIEDILRSDKVLPLEEYFFPCQTVLGDGVR